MFALIFRKITWRKKKKKTTLTSDQWPPRGLIRWIAQVEATPSEEQQDMLSVVQFSQWDQEQYRTARFVQKLSRCYPSCGIEEQSDALILGSVEQQDLRGVQRTLFKKLIFRHYLFRLMVDSINDWLVVYFHSWSHCLCSDHLNFW